MKNIIFPIALSALLAFSCKTPELQKLQPQLAVPIAVGNISTQDLLARQDSSELQIVEEGDGILELHYTAEPTSIAVGSLISLQDQAIEGSVVIGTTVAPFPDGQEFTVNADVSQNFSSEGLAELYKIDFSEGNLEFEITTTSMNDLDYELTISSFEKGGSAVSMEGTIVNGVPEIHSENLATAVAVFADAGTNENPNTFKANLALTFRSKGIDLNAADEVNFSLKFDDMKYNELQGYFGQDTIPLLKDSILLRIFRNTSGNTSDLDFHIVNPSLRISATHGLEIPTHIYFDTLLVYNENTNEKSEILLPSFENPVALNTPSQGGIKEIIIDGTNSDLKTLLKPDEQYVIIDAKGYLNPDGKNAQSPNIIKPNTSLDVEAKAILPLTGYVSGWIVEQTLDINADLTIDQVESGILHIFSENKFPLEAKLKLYFLNASNIIIDSIIPPNEFLLRGGIPNEVGRVTEAYENIVDLEISRQNLENIGKANKIKIWTELQTTEGKQQKVVSLYSDYFLKVSIGINATYNLN